MHKPKLLVGRPTYPEVIARLRELGAVSVRTLAGIQETVKFPLPKGLRNE